MKRNTVTNKSSFISFVCPAIFSLFTISFSHHLPSPHSSCSLLTLNPHHSAPLSCIYCTKRKSTWSPKRRQVFCWGVHNAKFMLYECFTSLVTEGKRNKAESCGTQVQQLMDTGRYFKVITDITVVQYHSKLHRFHTDKENRHTLDTYWVRIMPFTSYEGEEINSIEDPRIDALMRRYRYHFNSLQKEVFLKNWL